MSESIPVRWLEPGALVPIDAETTGRLIRMVTALEQTLKSEREAHKVSLSESVDSRADDDALRDKLADILSRTAVALKGPEAPLTRHSYHDLPELAALAKELAAQAMDKLAAESTYAELATETLAGIKDVIANGLKFDGAKWLLFESGRDAILDRIDATLAKNHQRQGADSPASATTDPSGEQDKARDAVTTAAPPLNAPLATPGAQSAPATHSCVYRSGCVAGMGCGLSGRCLAPEIERKHGVGPHAEEPVPSLAVGHLADGWGWKLVPVVPTEEMLRVGLHAFTEAFGSPLTRVEAEWDAMLAAAPSPVPSQGIVKSEGPEA